MNRRHFFGLLAGMTGAGVLQKWWKPWKYACNAAVVSHDGKFILYYRYYARPNGDIKKVILHKREVLHYETEKQS